MFCVFKQKTAYEMRISDWSSDVCSSDLKLTDKLNFQIIAGAEHSTITQTGVNGLTRGFFRPKGSISFAWAPTADFDISVKLRRRVLQLSFYDFLARAFLNDGNQNASNNDLRPQQDWTYEGEINKKFGPWG